MQQIFKFAYSATFQNITFRSHIRMLSQLDVLMLISSVMQCTPRNKITASAATPLQIV